MELKSSLVIPKEFLLYLLCAAEKACHTRVYASPCCSEGFALPRPLDASFRRCLNRTVCGGPSSVAGVKVRFKVQDEISHMFSEQPCFGPVQITHLISSTLGPPT